MGFHDDRGSHEWNRIFTFRWEVMTFRRAVDPQSSFSTSDKIERDAWAKISLS